MNCLETHYREEVWWLWWFWCIINIILIMIICIILFYSQLIQLLLKLNNFLLTNKITTHLTIRIFSFDYTIPQLTIIKILHRIIRLKLNTTGLTTLHILFIIKILHELYYMYRHDIIYQWLFYGLWTFFSRQIEIVRS